MRDLRLLVNGRVEKLTVQPQVSLLDALREYLGLTGTKKGCDQGACGACTVLVVRNDGLQCGYCTSGQICSAIGMLAEHREGAPSAATEHLAATDSELTPAEIRERMSGNICRCGAYNGIVGAIQEVAQ
jgi:xanthine dehydrogenase YagT iron-sulfur-binding subunit